MEEGKWKGEGENSASDISARANSWESGTQTHPHSHPAL